MDKRIFLIFALLLLVVSVSFAVAHTNDTDNLTQSDDDVKVSNTDKEKLTANLPLNVEVKWDDASDTSKRPSSVEVTVLTNGDGGPIPITAEDGWKFSISEIDEETDVSVTPEDVSGYTVQVTGDLQNGYTITYTLINETSSDDNSTDDDSKVENSTDDSSDDDSAQDQTVKAPSKKTVKTKKYVVKDKHNTGYPILLGVLAVSAAGLAVQLRRRE